MIYYNHPRSKIVSLMSKRRICIDLRLYCKQYQVHTIWYVSGTAAAFCTTIVFTWNEYATAVAPRVYRALRAAAAVFVARYRCCCAAAAASCCLLLLLLTNNTTMWPVFFSCKKLFEYEYLPGMYVRVHWLLYLWYAHTQRSKIVFLCRSAGFV